MLIECNTFYQHLYTFNVLLLIKVINRLNSINYWPTYTIIYLIMYIIFITTL